MPTVVAGALRTDQILAAKVPVEMRDVIDALDQERAFFEFLSRQIGGGVKSIENMRYDFLEQIAYPQVMTVNAISAAAATTVAVDNPSYAHRDQLIYNTRTGEFYLMNEDVGGVGTGGSITVMGHTGAGGILAATAVGDILQIGPEAHAEGEAIPLAYSIQERARFVYLFQHDRTRGNTDIQAATREYGPNQLKLDRIQFFIDEMRKLNLLMYIGKQMREVASASGPRRHSMSGIIEQISTNVVDFSAIPSGLTLAAAGEMMRQAMSHAAAAKTKIGICGQRAWNAFSAMPVAAIQTSVSETEWGKRLKTLVTPYGNQAIGYDNQLTDANGLGGYFFLLDPNRIERLQLEGQPTRLELNVQANNDIHNQTDVITGTDGIRLGLEELHAYAKGIN